MPSLPKDYIAANVETKEGKPLTTEQVDARLGALYMARAVSKSKGAGFVIYFVIKSHPYEDLVSKFDKVGRSFADRICGKVRRGGDLQEKCKSRGVRANEMARSQK